MSIQLPDDALRAMSSAALDARWNALQERAKHAAARGESVAAIARQQRRIRELQATATAREGALLAANAVSSNSVRWVLLAREAKHVIATMIGQMSAWERQGESAEIATAIRRLEGVDEALAAYIGKADGQPIGASTERNTIFTKGLMAGDLKPRERARMLQFLEAATRAAADTRGAARARLQRGAVLSQIPLGGPGLRSAAHDSDDWETADRLADIFMDMGKGKKRKTTSKKRRTKKRKRKTSSKKSKKSKTAKKAVVVLEVVDIVHLSDNEPTSEPHYEVHHRPHSECYHKRGNRMELDGLWIGLGL